MPVYKYKTPVVAGLAASKLAVELGDVKARTRALANPPKPFDGGIPPSDRKITW